MDEQTQAGLRQNTPYESSVTADNDPVYQYVSNLKSTEKNGVMPNKSEPIGSGNFDRNLNKTQTRQDSSTAVGQTLGQVSVTQVSNANNYVYSRTVEFPQPSIAGIGSVTAAGAVDSARFFFPSAWTITKTGTGVYQINHQMGDGKYTVTLTPINTAGFTACISNFNATNFIVRTFNSAGTASDCAFVFISHIIP